MHRGKPISLDRRPWLRQIYNSPVAKTSDGTMRRKMLLIFGRQCEKSTTIGNTLISLSNLIPYLRLLYVSASDAQMREFSDERLRSVISNSPILSTLTGANIRGARETQNVQTKRWMNQSKIVLRSVYRSADRVRGISSDVLAMDEIQDIYTDAFPVVEEVLFHSELDDGPMSIYAGTPKTLDNPLQYYWERFSTMNEWMIKCEGCNKWQGITEKHIGKEGLQCTKCNKELNPVDGKAQWVCTSNPNREWNGFRLPQPIVPYAYRHDAEHFERHWTNLLAKQKRYPRQRFLNEVMAESYDSGTKPVTLEDVRKCCVGTTWTEPEDVGQQHHRMKKWAGVDWGTGDGSYTVLSIWAYDSGGRFSLMYAKKYMGRESDPEYSWRDIIHLCKHYGVNKIGSDWGFGFYTNAQLRKAFGESRVMLYQHVGNQKDKVRWDAQSKKFTTDRSRVMQDVFSLIKAGPVSKGMAFPNWGIMEPFAADILSVYSEYSETRRRIVFNHPRGTPDDFMHTIVYAFLASQWDVKRPEFYQLGN